VQLSWMKKAVKAIVPPFIDSLGCYDYIIRAAESQQPIWLVLTYHRVISESTQDPYRLGMCVIKQTFERQIAFFKEYFEPIQLGEGILRIQQGSSMPHRAVSITFDDGYADNLYNALPILQQYAMPATIFVTTSGLETGSPMWWDRVITALYNTSETELTLTDIGLETDIAVQKLNVLHRTESVEQLLSTLWKYPIEQVQIFIERLEDILHTSYKCLALPEMMTFEQVTHLYKSGIEIGAHTISHPNLTLMTYEEIVREIRGSRQTLEALCGTEVRGFAYPSGYVNNTVIEAVKNLGFTYAVSCVRGLNRCVKDFFMIERIGAPESSVSDLKRCIAVLARRNSI
jgi:peptidoglycan/xylan/chitin deacetylase (PgdA/CDA1 family)